MNIVQGKICWDRCQFQGCATPHADKLRIFQAYYRMSSYDLQRTYLMALIEKVTTGGVDFYRYFTNKYVQLRAKLYIP